MEASPACKAHACGELHSHRAGKQRGQGARLRDFEDETLGFKAEIHLNLIQINVNFSVILGSWATFELTFSRPLVSRFSQRVVLHNIDSLPHGSMIVEVVEASESLW